MFNITGASILAAAVEAAKVTPEYKITVNRKGADTGIWHIGTDKDELISKAQQSVQDVFDDKDRTGRTGTSSDKTSGVFVTRTGINYRWEIVAIA